MKVQPITNKIFFGQKSAPRNNLTFKSKINCGGDSFVRKALSNEAIVFIKDTKRVALLEGANIHNVEKVLQNITTTNYATFRNFLVGMLAIGRFANVFEPSCIDNYTAMAIMNCTNSKNNDFAEAYTALGGRSFGIIKDATEVLNEEFPKYNLDGYSIKAIEDLIPHIDEHSTETLKKLVNDVKLNQYEMRDFLERCRYYSPEEFENTSQNIDNGFANLLTEIHNNPAHPIKKQLYTKDFQNMNSRFLYYFKYLTDNRGKLFDILKFPISSEAHLAKSLRNLASVMNNVVNHTYKNQENYETRQRMEVFFSTQFENLLGMLLYTDKETVLQIMDKGDENTMLYIPQQKKLTLEDGQLLSEMIRHGKKYNKKGELSDISAKDKVYAFKLVNINRNIFAKNNEDLEIQKALKPTNDNYLIDFKKIETNMLQKILKMFEFSDEELLSLDPKNTNWDSRHLHLLLLKSKNSAMQTLVKEASKGTFNNYIFSPDNEYGQANIKTKQHFENTFLDYDTWLNGIEPETFDIAGEKLSISLWNRTPQKSLFDGTYTTSCTSLDGPQGDSMIEYLMSTMYNVFEIKDPKNNVVATSRVFWVNEHDPTLIVDNIEINNTFKKKLGSLINLETLMEKVFEYERKFAHNVANRNTRLAFASEHIKLFDSDLIKYPKESIYIFETIGTPVNKFAYCNAISESIIDLPRSRFCIYDITTPI